MSSRSEKGVYFYRFFRYSEEIRRFIELYLKQAKQCGVVLLGKLPNPNEKQLDYYEEIMGKDFRPDKEFVAAAMKRWLPRLSDGQREDVVLSMMSTLDFLKREGKSQDMLRNAYIKFMCWLYYKFERILNQLGKDQAPKILYEGTVSRYELDLLSILAEAGCDIILLEYQGDQGYLKLDPGSRRSIPYTGAAASDFPPGFSIAALEKEALQAAAGNRTPVRTASQGTSVRPGGAPVRMSPPGGNPAPQTARPRPTTVRMTPPPVRPSAPPIRPATPPVRPSVPSARAASPVRPAGAGRPLVGTNAWLSGDLFGDSRKKRAERGGEPQVIYNMLIRMTGAEDPVTYSQELFRWKVDIEAQGRKFVVWESLPPPSNEEIQAVNPQNYQSLGQIAGGLAGRLRYLAKPALDGMVRKAFAAILDEEAGEPGISLNRLKNQAVYLACWWNRYCQELFQGWKEDAYPTAVYFGTCRKQEALFLRFLSLLPVDVWEISPQAGGGGEWSDPRLFERKQENTVVLAHFPKSVSDLNAGTVAYHAEQELNTMLYQDTGMYRERQYKKAEPLILQTMYEEISLLWDQELTYRPNFEVLQDEVVLPVLAAKVSGVKNGNVEEYWKEIRKLLTPDAVFVKRDFRLSDSDPLMAHTAQFFKNRRLDRQKIKAHKCYTYGILREEIQNYILSRIQYLIDRQWIRGTFTQGIEYRILAVGLSLNREILRRIQKFDFTKKNPKLIFVCPDERVLSLEDGIAAALLSLIGFDVVFFVPTGYQVVEQHFEKKWLIEHEIGEYLYDLRIPNWESTAGGSQQGGLWNKIFKRG